MIHPNNNLVSNRLFRPHETTFPAPLEIFASLSFYTPSNRKTMPLEVKLLRFMKYFPARREDYRVC